MKESQPIRYLALGDSLTEGIGADHPKRCVVSQFFDSLRHSAECQLKNFGISGTTSSELLRFTTKPSLYPDVTEYEYHYDYDRWM